ncbi:putative Longin domain, v-SNARE, coiled-coil domain-containing protein [Helianthus debilis subsp. tardiflorus]
MKITALLVLKCNPISDGSDPVILANATDVNHFGYFQRVTVRQFIVFVGRTVAKRTPPDQRHSVQHEGKPFSKPDSVRLSLFDCFLSEPAEYKVHAYNRNGLCVVGFMDDHYPVRSAFSVLTQVIDEYQKKHGDSWRSIQADKTDQWPYLNDALTKFQDPAQADKLLKIQRELDETKIILHKTIDSVLERGEKLDSLVEKSSDLSAASQKPRVGGRTP